MSFFDDWDLAQQNNSDTQYIRDFLDDTPAVHNLLITGNQADVIDAVRTILAVPMNKFIEQISHKYSFSAKEIFQYSKLDDAIITLCNILEYEEAALSFEEAGEKLTHASQQYACIKYGENHAKTAAMLSLVTIQRDSNRKCNMIRISSLGSVATLLSDDDRIELIRRLALRNPFMKTMVYKAKNGTVSYVEEVSTALTGQTIIRRKHNNEIVLNMILKDSDLWKNVRWQ